MMFAEHLLRHVPLAARIKKVLNERPGHRAPRVRFEQELEDFLSDKAAEESIDAVINWGRYGEIFSYNDQTEIFSLRTSSPERFHGCNEARLFRYGSRVFFVPAFFVLL